MELFKHKQLIFLILFFCTSLAGPVLFLNREINLSPSTQMPKEVYLKAKSIIKEKQFVHELLRFLRAKELKEAHFEVVRPETEQSGAILRYKVLTEFGEQTFLAKFPHSERSYDDRYREIELAYNASRAGVAPFTGKNNSIMVTYEIKDAVTLDKILDDPEWRQFFLKNEELFLRRIGEAYGILNKRARIIHSDVKLNHILITRDKRVFLLDFSESRFKEKGSHRNDLSKLYTVMTALIDEFEQTPFIDEVEKYGILNDDRLGFYYKWIDEGFEETDLEIIKQEKQEEILDVLRERLSKTGQPVKVLINLDAYNHIGTWWERKRGQIPEGDWARKALTEGLIDYYFYIPAEIAEMDSRVRLWTGKRRWFFTKRKIVELEFEELKKAKNDLISAEAMVTIDACSHSMHSGRPSYFLADPKYFRSKSLQVMNLIKTLRLKLCSPVYFAESKKLIHPSADKQYHQKLIEYLLRTFKKLTSPVKSEYTEGKKAVVEFTPIDSAFSQADTMAVDFDQAESTRSQAEISI